jgi:hypothetical protein
MDKILYNLYYNQQNYDGVDGLYKKAKLINNNITRSIVKEWLDKQNTKQITTKKNSKKIYLPIYSETSYSFQIDLTFFTRYKKQNKNYYVLFTAININTRYVYAYYGKDKEMNTILDMFDKMMKETVINSITCDAGKEFKNYKFIDYCKEHNIEIYFVTSDSHKLGIVNRFHRTLKEKLTRHFIATDSLNWVDVIDKIIYNYNHTINTSIGIEPYKVDSFLEHEMILFKRNRTDLINKMKNYNFKIGDKVRILNKKILFEDKMLPPYSSIVYNVVQVFSNACLVKYNDTEIRVKNDQLVKNNLIDNVVDSIDIPKLLNESKAERKFKREKLDEEFLNKEKRVIKKRDILDL